MSIPFSGALKRSGGIVSAIGKQIKQINLKAVKRVTFSFDPFAENVISTRNLLFHLTSQRIVSTNPNCAVKTDIVCDRSPPVINFILIPQVASEQKCKNIQIKSENLSTLELLLLCNKHISVLAPKEEIISTLKTKSEKKSIVGGGSRGATKRK